LKKFEIPAPKTFAKEPEIPNSRFQKRKNFCHTLAKKTKNFQAKQKIFRAFKNKNKNPAGSPKQSAHARKEIHAKIIIILFG
jgi:hypothetical protein